MATVYLATDLKHHRPVALKVLRSDVAGSRGADRFLREIRIASNLTHPNILPLHDSGRIGDIPYYVMPFVDGQSLRDVLNAEKQLQLDDALQMAREIADALAHAHKHGVVHRDIKPGNILVESGHPVVCDFGIAKAAASAMEDEPISKQGMAIGTPAYMSPEQATGEHNVDGRSDIYALGCVLYEMLIGEPPFTGPTPMAILARQAVAPPPSLRAVRSSLPLWVEQAIHRSLSKSPADRFQTATDFKKALEPPRVHSQELVSPRGRSRWPQWWIAIPVIGIASAAALALVVQRPRTNDLLVAKRVVVSPFENRTGSPELDPLGIMAADWITQGLQQTGTVDVIPTPTAIQSSRYVETIASSGRTGNDGKPQDPIRLLADETKAGIVISGTFYKEGDRLQFQVQVSDVSKGKLLTAPEPVSASVATPSTAIAELRTRLMGALASSFDVRLKGFAGEARQPPKYDSYREYALGIGDYVAGRYDSALPHFNKASALDSSFVSPVFYASLNNSNLGRYSAADSLLRRVEPYRSTLSEYDRYWLDYREALMHDDRPRALSSIRLAAAKSPGSKAVYNLAIEALENGFVDEALNALNRLTPERGPMRGWMPYWDVTASVLHLKGEHREELTVARDARKAYPARQMPIGIEVRALAALGRTGEMTDVISESRRMAQDPSGWSTPVVLREAGEELNAHGNSALARSYFTQLLNYYQTRLPLDASTEGNRWGKAQALYALGKYSQSLAIGDSLSAEFPDNIEYLGLIGRVNARLRQKTAALAVSEKLRQVRRPYLYGLQTQQRAFIAALLGDSAESVSLLRQSLSEGRPFDLWIHRSLDFQSLKANQSFRKLELGKRSWYSAAR